MKSLRKAICQYITVQENVQRYNNLNARGLVNLLCQDKQDFYMILRDLRQRH